MAESRRLRTQAERDADGATWRAALLAEATRWRVVLPAGVLKGITEADAYRLAAEHNVRPDRSVVRLYVDGTEELGPWSPAPVLPRPEDPTPAFLITLSSPVTLDQLAEIKDRLTRPGRPFYLTAELKITRCRWWHRYTRRNP